MKRLCLCGCRMPVTSNSISGYYSGHWSKTQSKARISRARKIWLEEQAKKANR